MNDTLIVEQDLHVLHAIRSHEQATVAMLAAHLGLPVARVRASVNRLVVRGLVRGQKIGEVRVEYRSTEARLAPS